MKPKILVVDDEVDALDLIRFNLERAEFRVITAETGPQAIQKAQALKPDLIVLDWMLPGVDGLEVCKALRADESTAAIRIIMLTAKAGEVDRVLGLELGADDYMTKPFSPRELVLRVQKQLRAGTPAEKAGPLRFGGISIDVSRHIVTVDGQPIDLTSTEFKLLLTLAERRGRVQSREELLRDVWEYEAGVDSRTVDTHMRRLRQKLGKSADYLETVRGFGYRLLE